MRNSINDFVHDGSDDVFLFVNAYEIFTIKIKCKQFNIENKGQRQKSEKRDLCHLTGIA